MGTARRRGAPHDRAPFREVHSSIVYLHSHDTGRYILPYRYALPTPNLQRLAADGVLFRQVFAAAPTCSPARAALLTGQAPHSSGMMGLAHRGWRLREPSQHLVHTPRGEGYQTALISVQHLLPEPGGAEALSYAERLETAGDRPEQLAVAERFLA